MIEVTNNHVRLALIVSALVVSLSIGYYLVIFLPAERRTAELLAIADRTFKKNLECREAYEKLQKEFNNVVGISYVPVMNDCVVKYTDDEGKQHESFLSDVIKQPRK